MAQMEEQPAPGLYAWIAQSAEHVLGKDEVVGSTPTPGFVIERDMGSMIQVKEA